MLGVRLDTDLEERLAAVSRTQGRSKSDVAREAVRRFVDLHDDAYRREARRQSLRASARDDAADERFWANPAQPDGGAVGHGAIVLVADWGDGAERPCVVVQSDLFNESHSTVTLCPLTSRVGGEALFRVTVSPREQNGLTAECEVQVDRIASIPRTRLRGVIGHASATRMEQIDQALRRWLML
ncbi:MULTISPECIES: type II toxin-antitoxin system PemK/MazF family toxin [unclassified Sphingomonas]|uniref:type II toxin-antitoxin system PemK/MazF family toxin n=1 Tax=unclassified Sphingomonas TaxID=196159 RepID=UPI002269B25B|nr:MULTISPECIES: type II toxin-antitoxin system PemK/MazF family toxin [unclassified Sphingomonas]